MSNPAHNQELPAYHNAGADRLVKAKDYIQLLKLHLCLYIGLSAILGHVAAQGRFSAGSFILGISLLVLALGSAVLNNIQDRDYDRAFERTACRSLPMKKVPLLHAALMAAVLIGSGLILLFIVGGMPCLFIGVLAVTGYNGLYTPLKKRSLTALIPGAISGMLPVLIGWAAVQGLNFDPTILMLMTILGLWQIPHFLILLLKTAPRKHRVAVPLSFPGFIRIFSAGETRILIQLWTCLYSLSIFCFILNSGLNASWAAWVTALNALVLPVLVTLFIWHPNGRSFTFTAANLSMLVFLSIGICDKIAF